MTLVGHRSAPLKAKVVQLDLVILIHQSIQSVIVLQMLRFKEHNLHGPFVKYTQPVPVQNV